MEKTQNDRIALFEAKVVAQPDNELHRFSLGKALFDAGFYEQSETHLRAALAKRQDWMVIVMLLAQCALHRNDKAAARAHYGQALQLAISQHHEGPEAEIRAALETLGSH